MVVDQDHFLTTREPGQAIARYAGGDVSVAQFIANARALAGALPDRPFVINLSADRYNFLLRFCAAVIAGQCTLMPPNRQTNTILEIASDYADCYVIGGDRPGNLYQFPVPTSLPTTPRGDVPMIDDDQLCAIVFTSGSTGNSTPNRKYWKTLREGTRSNAQLLLDNSDETLRVLATVPPQHMWGFEMSILLPLCANVAVSHQTPFFPQDIFDSLQSLPQPRALVSSPVHLRAFLETAVGELEIDRIYTATAPMSADLAQALERRFGALVIDVFGSSESGIIAARQVAREEVWRLADAFELATTDEGTQVLAEHLNEDVRLGDTVELLATHRFRWIGRSQDMINIAGKRGSLADLNQRLHAIPGVKDGVIFLPDEASQRLAAIVVAPGLRRSDILESLRGSVEPVFMPRPMYLVEELPRQATSKLPRKALLELFRKLREDRT